MRRALIFVAIAVALATTGCLPDGGGGAVNPFSQVYPARTRVVCRVPASGNPQKMLGFDTGWSFVYNGYAYWAAGDTFIDGNGNGVADEALGFRTGSIGRTTDLNASDCVVVKLRSSGGSSESPIFTPDTANHECLVWPNAPFEANGKLYFFYASVHYEPTCAGPTVTYSLGLGQLTNPGTDDLAPVRVGMGYTYAHPVKAGARIYLFAIKDGALTMARVAEARVANTSFYQYWNGSTWIADANAAAPLIPGMSSLVDVAYNAYLDRYMMVYTCGDKNQAICARTAKTTGNAQQALFGGWNDPTQILNCIDWGCGHAFWHHDYVDPAHPDRIYLSTANFPGRAYWVNVYEVSLSDRPAAATQVYAQSDRDFGVNNNWSYVGYYPLQPATSMTPLTLPSFAPPPLTDDPQRPPAWTGNETVPDSALAPGVSGGGMWPSETRAAGRAWTARGNGTVEISGNAWLESTKGDGAVAQILLIRGNTATTLYVQNLDQHWTPTRNLVIHLTNQGVQNGDKIVFGVTKGSNDLRNATKDFTYFMASVTFNPS